MRRGTEETLRGTGVEGLRARLHAYETLARTVTGSGLFAFLGRVFA